MNLLHSHFHSNFFYLALLAILTTGSTWLGLMLHPPIDPLSSAFIQEAWQQKKGAESITILFTGDIMLDRYIKTLRKQNPPPFPFTFMPDLMKAVEDKLGVDNLDLVVGNLEGPITDSSYVNNGTAMIFNFEPAVVDLLKNAGFTTFSMANNHTLDMGKTGPQETHDTLAAAGMESFGHPDTPNGEYSFITYDFGDTTVGFLGLNDAVIRLDTDAALAKIKEVDPLVDYLIIGVHWGWEYEPTARASVVEKAHAFVDAGADFIWGNHPYVIQNHETYNGVPIYYSCGNFVFDQYFSDAVRQGLVLGVKIENGQITAVEQLVDLVNGGETKPGDEAL